MFFRYKWKWAEIYSQRYNPPLKSRSTAEFAFYISPTDSRHDLSRDSLSSPPRPIKGVKKTQIRKSGMISKLVRSWRDTAQLKAFV